MGTFYSHLQEHIAMKARQLVMTEIQGLISQVQLNAQMGAVDPQAAQQKIMEVQQEMQNPAEVEKLVALQEMQIMQETRGDASTSASSSSPSRETRNTSSSCTAHARCIAAAIERAA